MGSATYGFATSNNTGQTSPGGEAGGIFDRNFIAKGYGDVHLGGKMTAAMPLNATGEFFLGGDMSNSDTSAYIGYFAQNTIGLIGDTSDPAQGGHDRFGLFVAHNNATGSPPDGTNFRFRIRMYNGNTLRRDGNTVTLPIGTGRFKYDFNWNPDTLVFTGKMLNVDGVTVLGTSTLQLNGGENVWKVDTYGLTHGTGSTTDPQPTRTYELYVDAVKYSTIVPGPKTTQGFDTSPSNWVKLQSPTWGFSNTNNTGQESPAGEAGGTINRDDKGRAYADISIGQITQAMPFGAAGEFNFRNPVNANCELLIGHFAQNEVDGGSQDPTPNKAGFYVQDASGDNFRFLTRMYTDTGTRLDGNVVTLPSGEYKFDYAWDPDTLTLKTRVLDPDGVTIKDTSTLTVPNGTTFTFDAFGLVEGFTGAANPPLQESFDVFVDNLTYTTGVVATGSQWNVDASGNWTVAGNWSGGAPNGAGSLATFGAIITAPRTVTLDAAQTVGGITFNNANRYTISGSSTLTIDASTGSGLIKVLAGSHTIAAPIVLADDTTVEVAAGQTLSVQHLRGAGLNVSTGTLRIIAGGSPNSAGGTSKVTNLTIASGASLDLTNNSAIVDYTGSVGTLVSDTRQHLLAGRLTSSSATTTRGLGYADNAALNKASFGGQSVDASSLLIKYTYFGDTDLDGDVDVADLGALATSWQTSAPWTGGDFDYSGFVDVADLGLLATNWQQGVGSPLGPSLSEALASLGLPSAAVPEPTTIGLLLVAASTGQRRHRRR